jgi:membrane protease YdiL (CAAX protease family)
MDWEKHGGTMQWELLYLAIFAGLAWLLDRDIDPYPPPLAPSQRPRHEVAVVLVLWGMAMGVNTLRMLLINPYLSVKGIHPAMRELIYLPMVTLFFLAIPLYISLKMDHYSLPDLGLTWQKRSTNMVIFALVFGVVSGVVAFWTGRTVLGIQTPSVGALLLLIYNNAFIEEFFYRGVIQNRLERVTHQRLAVLIGALLFATTHVLLDIQTRGVAGEGGWSGVLYALLMQTLGGCLLGLIFIKTRTLWPGVVCHYLVNWLPSILSLITLSM